MKNPAWDIQLQKTGYIREAGKCVVMLANIASKPFVIVLLDSLGKYTRIADAQRVKHWLETGESLVVDEPKARLVEGGQARPRHVRATDGQDVDAEALVAAVASLHGARQNSNRDPPQGMRLSSRSCADAARTARVRARGSSR